MSAIEKIFREPVNSITHLAGAIFSIVGLTLMVAVAAIRADAWHVVSFSIFGTTLVLMYTASFLYHGLHISESALKVFQKIDHIMIFLVIAGSYTPICLVPLRGPWGWSIFGVAWGIALFGIILKIWVRNLPRWISTLIYVIMGWICVIAVYPLVKNLEPVCLFWLAMGGLFYTIGAVIYGIKRPDPFPKIFGFHEIWHLLVIMGSGCHFWLSFKHLMYL